MKLIIETFLLSLLWYTEQIAILHIIQHYKSYHLYPFTQQRFLAGLVQKKRSGKKLKRRTTTGSAPKKQYVDPLNFLGYKNRKSMLGPITIDEMHECLEFTPEVCWWLMEASDRHAPISPTSIEQSLHNNGMDGIIILCELC